MDNPSAIRTFNSAKKFAEEVLHPLIQAHNFAKIRTRLGANSDEDALMFPPGVRMVKRANALKERIIYQQALLTEVQATVELNGRISEIELLKTLYKELSKLEDYYDEHPKDFLDENEFGEQPPRLTPLFKDTNEYLDKIYVQLQRIMTKNKLLFFGDDMEFLDEEDLMERIKEENRSA
jgi:hypothetical protein